MDGTWEVSLKSDLVNLFFGFEDLWWLNLYLLITVILTVCWLVIWTGKPIRHYFILILFKISDIHHLNSNRIFAVFLLRRSERHECANQLLIKIRNVSDRRESHDVLETMIRQKEKWVQA